MYGIIYLQILLNLVAYTLSTFYIRKNYKAGAGLYRLFELFLICVYFIISFFAVFMSHLLSNYM